MTIWFAVTTNFGASSAHRRQPCHGVLGDKTGGIPLVQRRAACEAAAGRGPAPLSRAVFMDRDGVLNRPVIRDGRAYAPTSIEEFSIYPEAAEACVALKRAGYLLVMATNQPDVGRGVQPKDVVERMHEVLMEVLPIDRIEVCYDPWERDSSCYKPAPGMLLNAARELKIDLKASFMVGDRWRDVDCGAAAGCRTVFIDRGYREPLRSQPDHIAANILEAAQIILANPEPKPEQ